MYLVIEDENYFCIGQEAFTTDAIDKEERFNWMGFYRLIRS
jgi:hypothetical protein